MSVEAPAPPTVKLSRDWRFERLWFGETISFLGTGISQIAIPLLALQYLEISVLQFGLLNALMWLPFALLALPLGAIADVVRRRPLLLTAHAGRAALLLAVPALVWADQLTYPALLVIVTVVGTMNVLFDVSFFAFVPSVVGRAGLVRANSYLHGSQSVSLVAGPAIGGVLVATLGPATAIGLDGLTFVAALVATLTVRAHETPTGRWSLAEIRRRIARGTRITLGTRAIRAVMLQSTSYNLYYYVIITLMYPYLLNNLHASEGDIARLLAISGLAAVAGSAVASRVAKVVGHGKAILLSACNAPIAACVWPLSVLLESHQYLLLTVGWSLAFFGVGINNVLVTSLRQAMSPPDLLSSSNAVYRLAVWGVSPLGSILAGALGTTFGFGPSFVIAWCVTALVPLWIVASPVPRMRHLPAPANDRAV